MCSAWFEIKNSPMGILYERSENKKPRQVEKPLFKDLFTNLYGELPKVLRRAGC